ncbi:MAG: MFS transporter [Elusimicrobia bacterium]|nr:MFS transporter [Elusimicrobiota bacterium]
MTASRLCALLLALSVAACPEAAALGQAARAVGAARVPPATASASGAGASLAAAPPRLSGATLALPPSSLPAALGPAVVAPALPAAEPGPAAGPAESAPEPSSLAAAKAVRLFAAEVHAGGREVARAPGDAGRAAAESAFARLLPGYAEAKTEETAASGPAPAALGEASALRPGGEVPPAIEGDAGVPAPAQAPSLARGYLLGTGIFKLGMEAVVIAMPQVALAVSGQMAWTAVMMVGWVLSQALASSLAGGMLDRNSPTKVLSRSLAVMAGIVTAILAFAAIDAIAGGALGVALFNKYTLLALYSLAGAAWGVADTARQVIPPLAVGRDERAIKLFNAKTHTAYEIAGVIGAVATGWMIQSFGLVQALILHPPAFLLAAWVFSRLRLTAPPPAAAEPKEGAGGWRDLREGMRTIFSHSMYRWGAFALIVPVVIHRIFEGVLIPAFAKGVLHDPAQAAWIMGASNFGELLGACLLMRAMLSEKPDVARTAFWVKLMAFGLLGLWALSATTQLWLLLPLVAFKSLSWAASDLSLRGKLQNSLPPAVRGRTFGFIGAVGYVAVMAISLGLGLLMDAAGKAPVIFGVNVGLTLLLALLLAAAARLAKIPPPHRRE